MNDKSSSGMARHDYEPWLISAGVLSATGYLYLAAHSRAYADITIKPVLIVLFINALICFAVWFYYHRCQRQPSLLLLLGFSLLYRVIGLFTFPILEDDFYRYLFDGWATVHLGSPYSLVPFDHFDQIPFSDIANHISYPKIATVYGPVTQWIFALSYVISPGTIWPLKIFTTLADIAIILLLLNFASKRSVLLYAWSPLIIKEFTITAHPDILAVLLVMLTVLFYQRKQPYTMVLCLALAAGIKVFALLLAPLLIALNWRAWLIMVGSMMVVAMPFGIISAWFPEGLQTMATEWQFNAPLYTFLTTYFDITDIRSGLFCVSLLWIAGFTAFQWRYKREEIPHADYLYGVFLLCIPVVNPWYLIWILPFATIRPSPWAWTASAAVLLSYASGINLGDRDLGLYQIPPWIMAGEYGLILTAIIIQLLISSLKRSLK